MGIPMLGTFLHSYVQNYDLNEVMVRCWQDENRRDFVDNTQNATSVFIHAVLISLQEHLYSCEKLGSFVENNFDKCS